MKDTQKFLKELADKRKEKITPHVTNILLDMFQKDLPIHDWDYIERRTREVLQEFFKDIDFKDKDIEKARVALIKAIAKQWKEHLPKQKEYRRKKLDKTERRNARCEPVVYAVLDDLMKDELIFSDTEYIDGAVTEQNQVLLELLIYGYIDQIFGLLEMSINSSLHNATMNLWNGKEKEEITMKEVDKVLKSNSIAQEKK